MEAERSALRQWLQDKAARYSVLLALTGLVILAVFLRSLHLLNHDNYYIVSPDSYFFHWFAGKIMAGEAPHYDSGSGLAYPIAYIAKAVSYVFGSSSTEALALVSKSLPPILAIITLIVIYAVASRIWGRRTGVFCALAWALMSNVIYIGVAGYLDRDALSTLLILIGVIIFYFSQSWHWRVGGKDVGWLAAGLAILGIEVLIYLEWGMYGPILILGILAIYFAAKAFLVYDESSESEPVASRRLAAVLRGSNWKTFAFIIIGNVAMLGLYFNQFSSSFGKITSIVGGEGKSEIAEMTGLGFGDLFNYELFLILMVLGIGVAFKKRKDAIVLFAFWFLAFLMASLVVSRILIYAAPAACMLSGIGLASIWDWMMRGQYRNLKKVGVATFVVLLILISFVQLTDPVTSFTSDPQLAVDKEWQKALVYIRENTPEGSVIMANWTYGYFILDLGQRRPLMDNGYYGHDANRQKGVALAYTANDPSEVAKIMREYKANYIIFTTLDRDYDGYAKVILGWAGSDKEYDTFPCDSVSYLSLIGEFESGGGLQVVYYNPEVVVLELTSK